MAERMLYTPGDYMCWMRHASWQMSARGTPFVKAIVTVCWNIQMRNGIEKFVAEPIYRDRTSYVFLDDGEGREEYNRLALMKIGWKGESVETLGEDCSRGTWVRSNCYHELDEQNKTRERWKIRLLPRPMKYDEDDPVAVDAAVKYLKLAG